DAHVDVHIPERDDVDEHDGVGDRSAVHLRPEGKPRPKAHVEGEVDGHLRPCRVFHEVDLVEPAGQEGEDRDEAGVPRGHADVTKCVQFCRAAYHSRSLAPSRSSSASLPSSPTFEIDIFRPCSRLPLKDVRSRRSPILLLLSLPYQDKCPCPAMTTLPTCFHPLGL